MGAFCGRPSQMIGLHFFNPVQLMQLVEVVKTPQTDPALFRQLVSLRLNKEKGEQGDARTNDL